MARGVSAVIMSTGFSGLAAAIELPAAGIRDITVLERADSLGGVWRENTYPGADCNVPAPYYSLSYAPNPHSPNRYTVRPEILEYMNRLADRFDVRRWIRFGTQAVEYVTTPIDAITTEGVRTGDGTLHEVDVLIYGTGFCATISSHPCPSPAPVGGHSSTPSTVGPMPTSG